jgi:hypothetical protein
MGGFMKKIIQELFLSVFVIICLVVGWGTLLHILGGVQSVVGLHDQVHRMACGSL